MQKPTVDDVRNYAMRVGCTVRVAKSILMNEYIADKKEKEINNIENLINTMVDDSDVKYVLHQIVEYIRKY